ncbi:MAG TPA: EamA family transporter [Terriglobales bacterium]|nr:EamA family transporter [Terriglobales bacterium]
MNFRKYLVLAGVVLFASFGDVSLSRGMKSVGQISFSNFHELFSALLNPWVVGGICLLILFFVSYLTALSWADLTYVLPATAIGYVLMALMAKFFLHENVTLTRWLGIALITAGVGFVAGGPAMTVHEPKPSAAEPVANKVPR